MGIVDGNDVGEGDGCKLGSELGGIDGDSVGLADGLIEGC